MVRIMSNSNEYEGKAVVGKVDVDNNQEFASAALPLGPDDR
jgi:thioredoxin-like negative regulator of GroEL